MSAPTCDFMGPGTPCPDETSVWAYIQGVGQHMWPYVVGLWVLCIGMALAYRWLRKGAQSG